MSSSTCLVYIAVANKAFTYPHGKSKIGYIGTTKVGADRIAASAAIKSKELLKLHGVTNLKFYVVTCRKKQKVKSWIKLERGLLLVFREIYGTIPKCNRQGNKMKRMDEATYFSRDRLVAIIQHYSK